MSIEKSVFDKKTMQTVLLDKYGLHLKEMIHLSLGTANCYKVCCDEGDFFFKEYQSKFEIEKIQKEANLVKYLAEREFPVARFIMTKEDESCFLYEGHVIGVQEYLEGKSYLNDLPHYLLKDSAKYLGLLHLALKDYPLETELGEKWARSISVQSVIDKYGRLLKALEDYKEDANYARIKDDLEFKIELFGHIEEMKEYFKGITYTSSHGDYTACQLICDDEKVKAVIDFSSAAKLPAVWEIMRSYIQSGACPSGQSFDIDDFSLYVEEYMNYFPLSQRDLEAMPYVYLFQLSRSAYGYEEYLIDKTENRDALLQFAIWRTEICKEIYNKADNISKKLMQLSKSA
ncbi:phosphotransferase [Butyrivibrio fibrisolvens]|uniref:phosphotransferase n=1 Tax=Butyrivibrio fibrisolvens TaxID=831 RepID=UPI0003FF8B4A|nr:phosphotransferase [Butyrivibrio fibrisolvens]